MGACASVGCTDKDERISGPACMQAHNHQTSGKLLNSKQANASNSLAGEQASLQCACAAMIESLPPAQQPEQRHRGGEPDQDWGLFLTDH